MKKLEIKFVDNKKEFDKVIDIRKTVFVEEQNVPLDLELDGLDSTAKHIIAYLDKKPVGCARLRTDERTRLERVAVLKHYRHQGFGKQIVKYIIEHCKNNSNISEIYLHSRIDTVGFYKKLGFKTRGRIFFEAGIEHAEMFLRT
ncbi:MAG: GNAT family N-acetyltransferase [Candidatus Thermoplasmatota archaeon]|nr:GNAT family N-acetyltransferase [Candidatus Thermoplasmatota archaeon]